MIGESRTAAAGSRRAAVSVTRDVVGLMRPHQWTKNVVVFAGLVFSQSASNPGMVGRGAAAFLAFCLLSSGVYALNDVADVERDRLHPKKCRRPIASGRITPRTGLLLGLAWSAAGLATMFALGVSAGITGAAYLALNLAYSFRLKHVVVLDVISISLGFVLRAIAGVEALRPREPGIEISPWLLVCTLFLALFLSIAKRRQELVSLEGGALAHRKALGDYTVPMLDQMTSAVTAVIILAYSLYTIWPATVAKFHTARLIYTVPFVVYGIFRYLFLVYRRDEGGNPSEVLLKDRALQLAVVGWGLLVALLLY